MRRLRRLIEISSTDALDASEGRHDPGTKFVKQSVVGKGCIRVGLDLFGQVGQRGARLVIMSYLDKAIVSLKAALAEAIQCGGADGFGCKRPRGEVIKLMNEALKKLYESGAQKSFRAAGVMPP